jgi:xanthine dehydrogenase large subunit
MTSPLGTSGPHDSAHHHVTGAARYTDDLRPSGCLLAGLVASPHPHARITKRCGRAAQAVPGVKKVLFASDIPGEGVIGPIVHDEPVLADKTVLYHGHPVAVVVAENAEALRLGTAAVEVDYEVLEPILSIDEAIAADAFSTAAHTIARGDVDRALAAAETIVEGRLASPAQDHFYLETHAALARPGEGVGQPTSMHIISSSQHPTEVQRMAARVLGWAHSAVTCEVVRVGGGFGGKESQASNIGALAALAAAATLRPVALTLNRHDDMTITGNRHPFDSRYRAGFDRKGTLVALAVDTFSDGGFSTDLSPGVMDRCLYHLDNAYFIQDLRFTGRVARTNHASNTAFRGFGGPQGMVVVEDAINRFAERSGRDPASVRQHNFYSQEEGRNVAPYGQKLDRIRLQDLWGQLSKSSDYTARRSAIDAHNLTHPLRRRGIGLQPIKFGISFTKALLNQAGALVHIYADGSVHLNHSGTEMGQGLTRKMLAVCAHELGVSIGHIRHMTTCTDKVPNTSPTAASSGSDLNGQAVSDACRTLKKRLLPVLSEKLGRSLNLADVVFQEDHVFCADSPAQSVPFADLAMAAWLNRVSLSATGFYATPGIHYDHESGQGCPFFYYAYGAAVVEVEVCGLTGEHRVLRADILHDVGDSLVPSIDIGQVEGAFVQGLGWLTCEEFLLRDGAPLTTGPSTYKIPSFGDTPTDLRVALLSDARQDEVIGGSKAVGEPPLMLAIAAVTALRHAIASFGSGGEVGLSLPATPEAILRAVVAAQKGQTAAQ